MLANLQITTRLIHISTTITSWSFPQKTWKQNRKDGITAYTWMFINRNYTLHKHYFIIIMSANAGVSINLQRHLMPLQTVNCKSQCNIHYKAWEHLLLIEVLARRVILNTAIKRTDLHVASHSYIIFLMLWNFLVHCALYTFFITNTLPFPFYLAFRH